MQSIINQNKNLIIMKKVFTILAAVAFVSFSACKNAATTNEEANAIEVEEIVEIEDEEAEEEDAENPTK